MMESSATSTSHLISNEKTQPVTTPTSVEAATEPVVSSGKSDVKLQSSTVETSSAQETNNKPNEVSSASEQPVTVSTYMFIFI